MARYIDADALMVKNHENVAVAHNERAAQLLENIMNAPTIEATPCSFCRYNPPSSGDGKPCTMCPASAKEVQDEAD